MKDKLKELLIFEEEFNMKLREIEYDLEKREKKRARD